MQSEAAAVHLEGAELSRTDFRNAVLGNGRFEGSDLFEASISGAMLYRAHLNGVDARRACFGGANLRLASLDSATELADASFGTESRNGATLVDVRWGRANLTNIEWSSVRRFGGETSAGIPRRKSESSPIETQTAEYERAARAYRQVAAILRAQGVVDHADRFSLRAQHCQRRVLWRRRNYARYLGSFLLNLISGYGYRPLRNVATYAIAILSFAALYWCVTNGVSLTFGLFTNVVAWLGMAPPPPQPHRLERYEAVVLSMSSFHGRGFYWPTQSPVDKVAILGAIEATIGLLIEITFIATFTQRFFARQ